MGLITEILLLLSYLVADVGVGWLVAWVFGRMFSVSLTRRQMWWIASSWTVLGVIGILIFRW
ncbi:hypothetical protein [Kyrpidia tusciae]|uniref:Uncharacterized protein n=1 Tax=Kyrpidia tusciae (strain DSM 2912 / NBRC 15312 / T2) TaxID=562970 RepID=D5WSE1_KYRT2|nr:hypothetical protein [Kyrpidia tusciae]ADG05026.1 conserved hypothetical protein [Kyrpidia tusciae DSM 2912]